MAQDGIAVDAAVMLSCRILAAYVHRNAIPCAQVVTVLVDVHRAIQALKVDPSSVSLRMVPPTAPQIKASISAQGLRSFENGQRYQTLKRHLASLGLSPDDYRTKWSLPEDYPMVSSLYSARRSALAKATGLGRRRSDRTLLAAE